MIWIMVILREAMNDVVSPTVGFIIASVGIIVVTLIIIFVRWIITGEWGWDYKEDEADER